MVSSPGKKIAGFFSSVKLAITLLVFIILASIIGTFIPQGISSAEYIQRYGRGVYNLFSLFGFTYIYRVWWFILLLSLLGLNLLICTLKRIKFLKKSSGLIITHVSILVILSGAIVGALWGERGFMSIYEGEIRGSFMLNNQERKIDFQVQLEEFILEWYPENHQITAGVKNPEINKVFNIEAGKKYPIEGTNYIFEALRYLPDFYLDSSNNAKTRGEAPNNPAVLVRINNGEVNEERWLFANFPDFSEGKDKNIRLSYQWLGRIKDFKSRLRVIEDEEVILTKTIEVNHPLKFRGYTFYQSSYDPEQPNWTGLQVVKDPGVALVYLGFILLNIGIILVFYTKAGLRQGLKNK
ncbi:MAG: cytochrome c biogenesis protein ResB [Candidatus Omnitrophota bacterium]